MEPMTAAVEATHKRFWASQERRLNTEGYAGTAEGLQITERALGQLTEAVQERLKEAVNKLSENNPLKPFCVRASALDAAQVALASLNGLLNAIAASHSLRDASVLVGTNIQQELWAAGLLEHDRDLATRVNLAVRRRHGSLRYRQQAARSIAARAGFRAERWTRTERLTAGSWLIGVAIDALPQLFTTEIDECGECWPRIIEGAVDDACRVLEGLVRSQPVLPPSTQPLQPWTGWRTGGYWHEGSPLAATLVSTRYKASTALIKGALKTGAMQAHVDGVNALQAVPWAINHEVLSVLRFCTSHKIDVAGLPSQTDVPMPERLTEDATTDDARRLQRYRLSQVRTRNRGLAGERVLLAQDMATAGELATAAAFYVPVNCDWRGRVYSIPHFNFQRDDRVRALFVFAHGLPIGTEGLRWLKIHVANSGDFNRVSKRSMDERAAWTDQNIERIRAVAWDPKCSQSLSWWTTADKPFQFLAGCLELSAALDAGASYVTRLPVSFDGSCSGLQHLTAMTRAAEGSLVNLTPSALPQDVYQTVADLAQARVAADAAGTSVTADIARLCLDVGITRKLVKRNVMTYSYSSKRFGMQQQHLEDTMRPLELDVLAGTLSTHPYAHPNDTREWPDGRVDTVVGLTAAKYLAGHIYAAIEQVVEKPAQAMAFLQKCARALAHEGKPLNWTTPTGLPWSNRYHERIEKRVNLWLSDAYVRVRVTDGHKPQIDKDGAANGVAPNFVHALDAAHLLLTASTSAREGITNLATVHDSFGCLAPQATRFNAIIREQFVQMYEQHDVLAEVLTAAKRDLTEHNWERLPDVPAYGPLNLREVLDAEYAFA
jgi:DNA-directed RNA polymerase